MFILRYIRMIAESVERIWFADSQMRKPHPETEGMAPDRLEYPEAWAKIRFTGTILVLVTREGGKEWIPSAVEVHAIPLSRMLK